MIPRAAPALLCALLPACVDSVGYPSDIGPWFDDDPSELLPDAPSCGAASIEPDDWKQDYDYSALGALQPGMTLSFCGRVSEARNNGQTYTGDIDIALGEMLEGGTLDFDLRWQDGDTDLDLAVNLYGEEDWQRGDAAEDATLRARKDDIVVVMVAGLSGPPTDYHVTIQVR